MFCTCLRRLIYLGGLLVVAEARWRSHWRYRWCNLFVGVIHWHCWCIVITHMTPNNSLQRRVRHKVHAPNCSASIPSSGYAAKVRRAAAELGR
jgi:hypothetical protein